MKFLSVRAPFALLIAFTVLLGGLYPLVVTLIAQTTMPHQAQGSLIVDEKGVVRGSQLIAQYHQDARFFWGRPSMTSLHPTNAQASKGSNLNPAHPQLKEEIARRVAYLREAHPDQKEMLIPVDLVTASGSGLDPHISVAAALFQISRVASACHIAPDRLEKLVHEMTERPALSFLAPEGVNVLRLNLAVKELCSTETSL